jgi:hypothetical protein
VKFAKFAKFKLPKITLYHHNHYHHHHEYAALSQNLLWTAQDK